MRWGRVLFARTEVAMHQNYTTGSCRRKRASKSLEFLPRIARHVAHVRPTSLLTASPTSGFMELRQGALMRQNNKTAAEAPPSRPSCAFGRRPRAWRRGSSCGKPTAPPNYHAGRVLVLLLRLHSVQPSQTATMKPQPPTDSTSMFGPSPTGTLMFSLSQSPNPPLPRPVSRSRRRPAEQRTWLGRVPANGSTALRLSSQHSQKNSSTSKQHQSPLNPKL